jgi:hypothetical protein
MGPSPSANILGSGSNSAPSHSPSNPHITKNEPVSSNPGFASLVLLAIFLTVTIGITGCAGRVSAIAQPAAASEVNDAVLAIDATGVSFGSVDVNAEATQAITLSSTGSSPVTVSAVSLNGSAFTVSMPSLPVSLSPGQSIVIYLNYLPTIAGSANGKLIVKSTSSTGSDTIVKLSGYGNPQVVQLSWDESPDSAAPPDTYNVYRAQDGNSQFELVGKTEGSETSFADKTVVCGKQYDYYVTRLDDAGNEGFPSGIISVSVL